MFEQATAKVSNGISTLAQSGPLHSPEINVGKPERILSLVGGSVLAGYGLSRPNLGGLLLFGLGGSLLYRGITGHCHLYSALDINTSDQARGERTAIPAGEGVKIEQAIVVNRPVEDVYRFWRRLENLPRIMRHLESVKEEGNRSHWVAKGPMDVPVEWDAEIITERDNELIGWRSLPGSTVATAGSVHFTETPIGTEVRVTLKYEPPAGKIGAAIAKLFGRDADQQISEDLEKFKSMMEKGKKPEFANAG